MTGFHSSMNTTGAALSPAIWHDYPSRDELERGPRCGSFFFTRFLDRPFTTPTTEANWASLGKGFSSTGGAIAIASASGGGVILSSDDDDECVMIGTTQLPFKIDQNEGLFCWEAQVQFSTIANATIGFFAGLLEANTFTATSFMADAGTIADTNFVGFHRLEGDGDQFDTVYKANGVDQVSVQTDAVTLAAATYVKIGMRFSPEDNILRFFSNGVELATTKTIPAADGTDFPNDVQMGLVFALKNAAGSTPGTATIRWVAAGQLF